MRGYLAEGYRWLDRVPGRGARARPRIAPAPCSPPACGLRRGVHARLHEFGAESVAIFRELGDHAGMFDAVEVSTAYRAIVSGPADIEALVRRARDAPRGRSPRCAAADVGGAHARPSPPGSGVNIRRRASSSSSRWSGPGARCAEPRPALWPLSYAADLGRARGRLPAASCRRTRRSSVAGSAEKRRLPTSWSTSPRGSGRGRFRPRG